MKQNYNTQRASRLVTQERTNLWPGGKASVLTVLILSAMGLTMSYGQTAPTTLPGPVKIQATITNTAALHVERAGSQPSAMEIWPDNGGNDMRFLAPDGAGGQQVMSYFNDSGVIHSRVKVVVSGTYSGTPLGSTITPPTADPFMLGIWSNIVGSAMVIRPNQYNPTPPVTTHATIATMDATGNYRFAVFPDGSLNWAASNNNRWVSAGFDTKLYRSGAGQLSTNGSITAAAITDTPLAVSMTNNSSSSVKEGTLVVQDPSRENAFLPATSDSDPKVVGVAQGTIAAGASGPLVVHGFTQVSVTGTVHRGDQIVTAAETGAGRRVNSGETVPSGSVVGRVIGKPVNGKAGIMISQNM